MDSVVEQAARALAAGDPLRALKGVALREDPPALALRGIAMAQLGELRVARKLLQRAARGFGAQSPIARARCMVAEAEVALANHDPLRDERALHSAVAVLAANGDLTNAAHGALVSARRLVLLGRLEEAERVLSGMNLRRAPPRLVASAGLVAAEIATRRLAPRAARVCLGKARLAADRARIPALAAEIRTASARLNAVAARQLEAGVTRDLRLEEIEALSHSPAFVVDACRRELRVQRATTSLVDRPVLFDLLWALAEAFPAGATRSMLIERAFGLKRVNESARVRLRVEIGRLRKVLAPLAGVSAAPEGFILRPARGERVCVLTPPSDDDGDALLGLLSDGQAWSTSALAQALGKSQRGVQRALQTLENADKVAWFGRGKERRWQTPTFSRFATSLLLVATPGAS
ncbi:MAG: helix-turn-helix domain-containing protein [Pseudomonadota bacterium]